MRQTPKCEKSCFLEKCFLQRKKPNVWRFSTIHNQTALPRENFEEMGRNPQWNKTIQSCVEKIAQAGSMLEKHRTVMFVKSPKKVFMLSPLSPSNTLPNGAIFSTQLSIVWFLRDFLIISPKFSLDLRDCLCLMEDLHTFGFFLCENLFSSKTWFFTLCCLPQFLAQILIHFNIFFTIKNLRF